MNSYALTKELDINEELYREVSSKSFLSSIALFINLIVIAIAFYSVQNRIFLFSWLSLMSLLLIIRTKDTHSYINNKTNLSIENLTIRFKILTIFIAIVLSMGIICITPIESPFYEAFSTMLIAGLSAGAVMTLSFYQDIIRAYLIILVLPFAVLIFSHNEPLHCLLALLMMFFVIMLLIFSKKFYENILSLIISKNTLYTQAHVDHITGLPNRTSLYNKLQQEIHFIQNNKTHAALLYMDIDNFKTINDTLGHDFGDKVLQIFSSNINSTISANSTFARLGGDEFVILLSNLDDDRVKNIELTQTVAQKLHKEITKPFTINDKSISLTVSIGIKIFDHTKIDIHEIMKNADIAMYQSKDNGKNTTSVFESYMSDEIQRKLNLSNELNDALKNDEFELYYQPIVNTKTDKIVSCEALIRWNHPEKGLLYPDSFIHHAEQNSELIIQIGQAVILRAIKDYNSILSKHIQSVALNISAKHFMMEDFVTTIYDLCILNNINPSVFKIEITESSFINNLEDIKLKIKQLKEYGFQVSMDDFGTGYSSLSYLKNLDFDFLKIDRSFIMDIIDKKEDASLVKMIISIAKELNMKVIAEGVEDEDQLNFLKEIDCTYYQGYLKSKPIALSDFVRLISNEDIEEKA